MEGENNINVGSVASTESKDLGQELLAIADGKDVDGISTEIASEKPRRGRPPKLDGRSVGGITPPKRNLFAVPDMDSSDDVSDIVNIDKRGRAHAPKGKFISNKNLDVIKANADRIRSHDTSRIDEGPGDSPVVTIPREPKNEPRTVPQTEKTLAQAKERAKDEDIPESSLAGMGHEPYTFEEYNKVIEPPEPSPPTIEVVMGERLDESVVALDRAISNYAAARIAIEKIFGGRNQEQYDRAESDLQESFREYSDAYIASTAAEQQQLRNQLIPIQAERSSIGTKMDEIRTIIDQAKPTDDVAQMYSNLEAYEARLERLQAEENAVNEALASQEQATRENITRSLATVSTRVENEMLEQRTAAHPRLARINEWLRKNPGKRFVAGAALAGAGIFGALTGNIPLVVGAIGLRSALAGYGGYNAVRGVGERIADRRFDSTQIQDIEDYTGAAERQSVTRRRSKKTGAAVGTGLAAIPIARNLAQGPPEAKIPTIIDNGPAPGPGPVTDTNYPWTHFSSLYGADQATPRIMSIANNAQSLGWQVVGNGQGGGTGAILRIISPDGTLYEGNGPINSALDYLDKLTPR